MAFGRTLSALLVCAILACPVLCSAETSCTSCLDACGDSASESHHPERDCGEHPCFCHALQSADQGAMRAASASATVMQLAAFDCATTAIELRPDVVECLPMCREFGGPDSLTFIVLPLLI